VVTVLFDDRLGVFHLRTRVAWGRGTAKV
jgi:hypothetical protein